MSAATGSTAISTTRPPMFVGPTNCHRRRRQLRVRLPRGQGERGCLGAGFFQGAGRDPAVSHALGDEPVLRRALFTFVFSLVRLAPFPFLWRTRAARRAGTTPPLAAGSSGVRGFWNVGSSSFCDHLWRNMTQKRRLIPHSAHSWQERATTSRASVNSQLLASDRRRVESNKTVTKSYFVAKLERSH